MFRYSTLLALALVACGDTEDTSDTGTDTDPVGCPADDPDLDGDGVCGSVDCNDDPSHAWAIYTYPGADEIPYNGNDEDCDGSDLTDVDGDGHDSDQVGGDDCMDSNPTVYPGAFEKCYPDLDYNCDGVISEDDCDLDGSPKGTDCDDENPEAYPGAEEVWYNGVDEDCSNTSDFDFDNDGDDLEWQDTWPDPNWPEKIQVWRWEDEVLKPVYVDAATAEETWPDHGLDCQDTEPLVGGLLDELWDGIDRNCDDQIDVFSQRDAISNWYGSGSVADTNLGHDIVFLGDLDGDGVSEVAISDFNAGTVGRVNILSADSVTDRIFDVNLASIDNSGEFFSLIGWSMDNMGDLDGDGLDELAVGAPIAAEFPGVLFFKGSKLAAGGTLDIAADAFAAVYPQTLEASYPGMNAINIGDVSDDGVNDIAVAGNLFSVFDVYLFSGADIAEGGAIGAADTIGVISSPDHGAGDLAGGIDLTGDGVPDAVMGSFANTYVDSGGALIYDCSGATGGAVRLFDGALAGSSLSPTDLDGVTGGACLGLSVAVSGDIDGDGYGEIIAGDPGTKTSSGGAHGGTLYIISAPDFIDGSLASEVAFTTLSCDRPESFARTDHKVGDFDGDGLPDPVLSCPGAISTYLTASGAAPASPDADVHAFYGVDIAAGGAWTHEESGATFYTFTSGSGLGISTGVGPVNANDSVDDLIIGAAVMGTGNVFVYESLMAQ